MGVIDLNARVTELEKYGGGQIDQLEAAITAIENLLTVTSMDITADCETPPDGVSIEYALLDTYGKQCIMTVMLGAGAGSTATDLFTVYTIPAELHSTLNYMSNSTNCTITGDGDSQVVEAVPPAAGEFITYSVTWLVGDPAPEPGE